MVYYEPGSEGRKAQEAEAKRRRESGEYGYTKSGQEYVKGQLLLGFAKGTTEAEARRIVESRGGTLDKWFGASGGGAITINNPSGNIEEDIKKFSAGPSVRYAERNSTVSLMGGPVGHQQQQPKTEDRPGDPVPMPGPGTGPQIGRDPSQPVPMPGIPWEPPKNTQYIGGGRLKDKHGRPIINPDYDPAKDADGNPLPNSRYIRGPGGWIDNGRMIPNPDYDPTKNAQGITPDTRQPQPGAPPNPSVSPEEIEKAKQDKQNYYDERQNIGAPPEPTPEPTPEPEPEPEPLPDQPAGAGEGYRHQEQNRFENSQRLQSFRDRLKVVKEQWNNQETSRENPGDMKLFREMAQLEAQIKQHEDFLRQTPSSAVDPAPAPAPAQQQPQQTHQQQQQQAFQQQQSHLPAGLTHQDWAAQGFADIGLPDRGLPGSQPSMMDLWGGGGQQAPTQQWGGQQGWQMQQQGQTFRDPITGRTLDRRTAQPVALDRLQGGEGIGFDEIPDNIRHSPEMLAYRDRHGSSINKWTRFTDDDIYRIMRDYGPEGKWRERTKASQQRGGEREWQRHDKARVTSGMSLRERDRYDQYLKQLKSGQSQQRWGGWQDAGGQQGWGGSQPSLTNIWQQQGGGQMAQQGGFAGQQQPGQQSPGGGAPGMSYPGGPGGMQPGQRIQPHDQWGGFPGVTMPGWATLPDSNLVGQPQQPLDPGFGTGQPGQNVPGAGVIPGLPPVAPIPGAAPELGQYGQEVTEAATSKLQQAPQSGVPSGSPVVYPSSQPIAPTTRQGGGNRRGGGGATPFSYGVKVR